MDRTRIEELGLNETNVTSDVATSIAGTSQTAPEYWLNPKNGVTYPIVAQMPEYRLDSLQKLSDVPVSDGAPGRPPQVLGGLGRLTRDTTAPVLSHTTSSQRWMCMPHPPDRDLGGVADDVQATLKRMDHQRPKTVNVTLRGQFQTMRTAFTGMQFGLLGRSC